MKKAERYCSTHHVAFKNKRQEVAHKLANKGCDIGWRVPK